MVLVTYDGCTFVGGSRGITSRSLMGNGLNMFFLLSKGLFLRQGYGSCWLVYSSAGNCWLGRRSHALGHEDGIDHP